MIIACVFSEFVPGIDPGSVFQQQSNNAHQIVTLRNTNIIKIQHMESVPIHFVYGIHINSFLKQKSNNVDQIAFLVTKTHLKEGVITVIVGGIHIHSAVFKQNPHSTK